MLARIRKAKEQEGFTLIELLVVMIIIGILAAIAIPVFLSQRAKAQDSAAKADVSTVGKEVATYYVDGTIVPTVTIKAGRYVLNAPAGTAPDTTPAIVDKDLGAASTNVAVKSNFFTDSTAWCVSVENPKGDKKLYKYSAAGGLKEGTCASAAG